MRESMHWTPWLNMLIVLLTIIAAAFMLQMLWGVLGQFSDIMLLFVLAWLVAFILSPSIKRIEGTPLPSGMVMLGGRLLGRTSAGHLGRFRVTRRVAVAVIYLSLVLILLGVIAVIIPPLLQQLRQIMADFPALASRISDMIPTVLQGLDYFGIHSSDISTALSGSLGSLQNVATLALQNAVGIVSGIATLLANLGTVLLFSFFIALDGPRLFGTVLDLIPEQYHDDVLMLTATTDRVFGGYVRVALPEALLISAGTALVLWIFGQPYILVASLFAGFCTLIPFVGSALALVPPVLATLSQDPAQAPVVFAVLLVYEQFVVSVIEPRLMSSALGLHQVIVMVALLIGVRVAGFGGALFAVPIAAVIVTMAPYLYRRALRSNNPAQHRQDRGDGWAGQQGSRVYHMRGSAGRHRPARRVRRPSSEAV